MPSKRGLDAILQPVLVTIIDKNTMVRWSVAYRTAAVCLLCINHSDTALVVAAV
jgi:hypothetical protein